MNSLNAPAQSPFLIYRKSKISCKSKKPAGFRGNPGNLPAGDRLSDDSSFIHWYGFFMI